MTTRVHYRRIAAGLPIVELELALQEQAAGRDRSGNEARYDWRAKAREKQLAPAGPWRIWLLRTGRRWGKTLTGAQWVREQVERHGRRHIALVSDTAADVRDVMIEGPKSGILAICPPWNRPLYEPSKRRLTWPNGAFATAYSADDPEQLRGPGHDAAWADELGKWRRQQDTFDNLMLTLSEDGGQCVITTTPRATKLIKQLSKRSDVVVTLGHTRENAANLDADYLAELERSYEGTRLGRQELAGEILQDVEGALWTLGRIEELRVTAAPEAMRVVVAIDPSGSDDLEASEQGIVAVGRGVCFCKGDGNGDQHCFVLADVSGHRSPEAWARRAIALLAEHEGDRIVAENNFGGQMVEATLRAVDEYIPYKPVTASRGKQVRAEPVAAMYEKGQVHHVGVFPALEDQLCNWTPGMKSPDRLDALVWAVKELTDTGSISVL